MISKTTSLILCTALLQSTCTSASITGKVLKYTSIVAAPFVLKHTLLAQQPAKEWKEIWRKSKEDAARIGHNIGFYEQLMKTKVTNVETRLERVHAQAMDKYKQVATFINGQYQSDTENDNDSTSASEESTKESS